MIAIRLLSRNEVEKRLAEFGCKKVDEETDPMDRMYWWSYWRTSWGFHFYIPELGPDRMTPAERFDGIIADIREQQSSHRKAR
jgi:hypothetical protein